MPVQAIVIPIDKIPERAALLKLDDDGIPSRCRIVSMGNALWNEPEHLVAFRTEHRLQHEGTFGAGDCVGHQRRVGRSSRGRSLSAGQKCGLNNFPLFLFFAWRSICITDTFFGGGNRPSHGDRWPEGRTCNESYDVCAKREFKVLRQTPVQSSIFHAEPIRPDPTFEESESESE